ncbi:hypothetical protein I317_00043 [Kwoniella heveanensis CBS 569]|nr:hypothetical protein I317_00043 [Kwoniella heveanensis CBS 569]
MLPNPKSSSSSSSSSSIPRIQARPSTSSSTIAARPMASRPPSGSSQPQLMARPPPNSNASVGSSSAGAGRLATKASLSMSSNNKPSPVTRPAPASRASSSTASTPNATSPSSGSASASSTAIAPLAVAGKDTSSSAGKIFAKPSKEWVLPERAKPGRKVSVEEPDNKRQSQNRLSQRAHRARRTDYIQTLEERLRQYEADEIHSNVRLQEVARALKADNERLKSEVNALKTKCMEYNGDKDVWEMERRGMQDALRELRAEVEALRAGRGMETIVRMEVDQNTIDSLIPGPSPMLSRRQSLTHRHSHQTVPVMTSVQSQKRDLVDCPICPNPDPDCPCQQGSSTAQHTQAIRRDVTLVQPSSCGLCHSTDECLCRVVEEEDIKPDITSPRISSPTKSFKSIDDGCGLCAGGGFCACRAASNTPSNGSGNSNSNLAPVKAVSLSSTSTINTTVVRATSSAAAMPLRFKSKNSGVVKPSIWSISNASAPASPKTGEAVCTGDPSNCDACKNDSFGREFCQHLFEGTDGEAASGEVKNCSSCSGNCMSIKSLLSPSTATDQSTLTSTSASGPSTRIVTPPSSSSNNLTMDDDVPPLAPLQMTCCGNPELCGGHSGTGCTGEIVALNGAADEALGSVSLPGPPPLGRGISFEKPVVHLHTDHDGDHTTLRPDQAWKQLKAHPNAKFASLALLADVVARRTTSLNPTSPSPMPSSPIRSPALSATGAPGHSRPPVSTSSTTSAVTGAGAGASAVGGKKRNFELETSAVRDALRLLDSATPAGSPAPGEHDHDHDHDHTHAGDVDGRDGKRRRLGV